MLINRSVLIRLRKGLPRLLLWMVLFSPELVSAQSQMKTAIVVQVLGPLFSIDQGTEMGIEPQSYFKIYNYSEAATPDQQWNYIGTAKATQVFATLSVWKFVEQTILVTPKVSDFLTLYPIEENNKYFLEHQVVHSLNS